MRWTVGGVAERWLPALQGLSIRSGDRVLLVNLANWPEPLVVGVVDGFAKRPESPRVTGAEIQLLGDEALRVTAADGTPLVEVFASQAAPVVMLAQPDVLLEPVDGWQLYQEQRQSLGTSDAVIACYRVPRRSVACGCTLGPAANAVHH